MTLVPLSKRRKIAQPFDTYVLPISGTDFVRYTAAISFLAAYRRKRNQEPFKPKVIYAASGGCLVSYLAMMSSFSERVEDWTFSSDMFVNRPTPITPRLLTFSLRGFLYHRVDLIEYVKEIFIPAKLQDVEIVTGYYEMENLTTFRSTVKIVTNMPASRSSLTDHVSIMPNVEIVYANEPDVLQEDRRSTTKAYLNEVMLLVIDALHKTSNIPYMMEPLGEASCVDYGVIAPSPRVVVNGNTNRSIYFSPVNIDRIGVIKDYDMIFHKFIMNDLVSLRNTFQQSRHFEGHDADRVFADALSFLQDKKRYCLVIYSTTVTKIPIDSFTNEMVKLSVAACKESLHFTVFYDVI